MDYTPQLTVLLTDAQLERLADMVAARMPQPAPVVLTEEQSCYTVAEAAEYLRVHPQTIYNAVAAGEISRTPIGRGREYRISAAALHQYTASKAGAA